MRTSLETRSRRYAAKLEQWEEVMADWKRSGMNQQEYCIAKQLSYWTFKSWRSKLKCEKLHSGLHSKDSHISDKRFIPLKIEEPTLPLSSNPIVMHSEIAIKTRQGYEVRLSSDFSEENLISLLRAIRLSEGY